ncbi:MAG: LLM class flavin-dependent oxidoreductase [Rhodospirillales bacterium]
MKFGLFDHVDKSTLGLAQQFDDRLEFVAAADEFGLYSYHIAEHHATPLNMVPVPGVYLGAVARLTKRIRLGPLVYLLPLYSPLRLIEEIGILDHLCHGRLDIGVGRGISPYELNYHRVDPESSREIFIEALDVLLKGMTSERLTHQGKHFDYENVPMELPPMQQPHPPIWYGSSNAPGSAWAAEKGYNFVTLGGLELAKGNIAAFKEAYAERNAPGTNVDFEGGSAIGVMRHIVIADSHEEAMKLAAPTYDHWHASLTKLERENVRGPAVAKNMPKSAEEAIKVGMVIVGTAETVGEEIERQIEVLGLNYMIIGMYFGSMKHATAMNTLEQFSTKIMPGLVG